MPQPDEPPADAARVNMIRNAARRTFPVLGWHNRAPYGAAPRRGDDRGEDQKRS